MTLAQYRDNTAEIIQNVPEINGLVCNLESDFNRDEFLEVFKFYKETLELNSDYGIIPNYLFFVDRDTINAMAGLSPNGNYLIGINRGTINWLINNFKFNDSLISDSNVLLFEKLEPFMNTSINNLMYQAGCHFTFYHEMAHLIQKSDYLGMNMQENPSPVENFDIGRHLMELDADTYSALCLGTHIMQYADRLFGDRVTKPLLEALIVLFSIPIIFYLLSFAGNRSAIYFKESTHPHPAIRLTNFLMVLTHYINGSLTSENKGFTANQGDMFIYAMDIAEELQGVFFNDLTVTEYRNVVTKNRLEVIAYMSELIEMNEGNTATATYKWNIRSQQS
ncbi:hypothetical protein [Winogradskyella poriferorum]|uniref:Zinc-dependent peptidase n=1 Tax=Winogradskyella poriferorum TaxID=307627 RepID=A0ABU7W3G6_9FLAO